MAKDEPSNQLNLTVVALVAVVAIVGLVALVMNAAATMPKFATGSEFVSADNAAGDATSKMIKKPIRYEMNIPEKTQANPGLQQNLVGNADRTSRREICTVVKPTGCTGYVE